ncbi:MAG: ATP-binding protein [Ktedonobacteraceae bacterium]
MVIPTLHIHLLGDFLLVSGEIPVTTVTVPRIQSLLAYLVLHRSAPQDRSHLAFLLWPDSTESQAHTNLRQLLYHLRQSLPDADRFLHADKHSLQWLPAHADACWTLDIMEIEQAQAAQAEQPQDTSAMRQALEQVLHLYRGDLLPSCYEEWILPERDRLHQVFLSAAERLIALLEQERDYDAAITAAQQLLRQDPLHEATYRQLMRLYALRGDRAAALRIYHTCVTLLERELGTEPSQSTRAVYKALVQSDTSSETLTGPLTKRGTAVPLLGRKVEWRQLQEAWRQAAGGLPLPQTGSSRIVILSGEAGIGKTRLAEEMEAWVGRQGMATASARCYAAEGRLAYAPVTTWLRSDAIQAGMSALDPAWLTEIARLVPEVLVTRPKLPRPAAMTEGWQRQHFFEALARAVLRAGTGCSPSGQPLLLLLDDLQWCDNETLQWLHYLLRFEPTARLLLIGTVRSEETFPGHPLVSFLATLQRDGLVTEIALGPLTTTETTSLAEHVAGRQLDPVVANCLYSETEGNPLFVVEMARAGTLEQRAKVRSAAKGPPPLLTQPASTLPPTVQTVLATRLAQLSPQAREVANVAAVIGREFAFSVLARASGGSEDTIVRGLDELWQRRLVREQGTGTAETYDFSHDKLREQVYTTLSPTYRRLLHRRVAEAFKAVYVQDQDAVSGEIAAHYERAGLPDQAIPSYQRAGEVACRFYANADAMNAFERAAALLEAHPPGQARRDVPWETAGGVYELLGDVTTEMGRYEEASQAYLRAMTYVLAHDYIWRARLQRKMANMWNLASTNPYDTVPVNVRQAFQEAEHILTQASEPSSPAWRHEWIELQFAQVWPPMRWSADDLTAAIRKARPIVEQYGTQEQREFLAYARATRALLRDRYVTSMSEEMISFRRAELAAIEQTGNKSKLGLYHLAFGFSLLFSGHLDEAEEQLGKALRVGEQIGNARLQTHGLTFLPFIFRWRGQVEQVRSLLARAQAVGAARNNRILAGHRAWIAWRDGNLAEAETYGRASVEQRQYQQPVNPFLWTGLWPLVGVALAQEKIAAAMDDVRMLLDPSQQPPPRQLGALLEAALRAWDAGEQEAARALLQQAVPFAESIGYL